MFSLVTSRQGMGVTGDTPYGCDFVTSEYEIVLNSLDCIVEGMRVLNKCYNIRCNRLQWSTTEVKATLGTRCKCFGNKEVVKEILMVWTTYEIHSKIPFHKHGAESILSESTKNASAMSEEEEEVVKIEDRGGQDPEYEIYGGRGVQMADPEHLSAETQERPQERAQEPWFPSLSRSSTQSLENLEKAYEEVSKVEKIFKPQALSSKLESFKDVEGIWFNKDVWVIPPADTDDEVLGSSLVDDDDEDEDEEGGWGQHPSSARTPSDYLQSRIRLRAKMESDFLLVVKNLLQEEGIPEGEEGDPNNWPQIVSNLALQAANYVKPNTSKGGGMDPGEYVKVKCIASGKCADSTLVKGIVCHKNVQNRRMTSRFKNPRLLLLGGALEYQRSQNQLSSLTGLPQQETDYLTATVARIDALHPNVLLVEKTVAGIAQETLLSKAVSLVLKVKRPLLNRIARCTGANVISSVDNFEAAKVGQCEQFHIEKFEEELNPGGGAGSTKKNTKYLMFFEGCPRPLGCTILLQGASTEELKRVKKAVQLTVSYAYHLSLETSFLADEGASLPPNPLQCIPSSKRSSLDSTITTVPGFTPPPSRAPSHGRNNIQAEDGVLQRGSSYILDTQQFTGFTEDEFPPSTPDHQSIVVSVSSRTMSKGNVCEKPQLKRIKYYGPSDKPIGIFLKEFLGNTVNRCPRCDEPMEDHEHRYAHSRGCLTLYSKVLKGSTLPGEKEGKIWMWHRCLRCPRPDSIPPSTRRVPLSEAAQNISFGKLLQLNFSDQAVMTTTACGHQVYRDCLRFFGIGNTVACLMYNPIKLLSVLVPPPQIEFNIPSSQAWLKVEAQDIVALGVNLFTAATEQLRGLGDKIASLGPLYSSKALELRSQLAELESLLQKEKEDFEEQLQMAAPLKEGVSEPIADILALNKLRRHLALVYNNWEGRVKKLFLNMSQTQNAASVFIPSSYSEVVTGAVSSPEEPSSGEPSAGGPVVHAVPLESESGAGLPKSIEGALDQLSLEDPPVALEETTSDSPVATIEGHDSPAEQGVEISDTSNYSVAAEGAVSDEKPGESEGDKSDDLLSKSLALDRRISNPLPLSSTIGSVSSEMSAPSRSRPLSEGDFPIMVDLPFTIEAAWRGEGGSIDASVVEAPVAAPSDEEAEVSDLTAINASTSQQQEDEVGATTGDPDLDVSRPTSLLEDKVVADGGATQSKTKEPSFGGTSPLQEVDLAVSSRPSSPLKDKEGVDLEVSRPASPLEETSLVVSRPPSPFKDKEESEEAAGVLAPSSTFNKGSRSPSRVLQSASSVYTSAYSRSNSTVPKVQQFFLQGVARVRLPPGVHGAVIAVYEDEPTSVIAYVLTSREYQSQLQDPGVQENTGDEGVGSAVEDGTTAVDILDEAFRSTTPPLERPSTPRAECQVGKALTSTTPLTVKVRFTDYYSDIAKTEYQVLCYYTRQFIALRLKCCGGETEYIRSLSRCKTWGAQGGKSKAYFAKTLDDRFIVKQVSSTEKYSFLEFAPQYFKHLWETMSSGSPTCLAKILGFYTVTVRKGGKGEKEMDMMVMENLVYGKNISRMYDLKGSLRSRYNPDATGTLLDQNLLEDMPTSPIFMTNHSKLLLERAVYNDTSFLAKVHVMDYSLLAVVLEDRQELVIGIIDYIRQYTWDKHLETWVKASGILGGSKHITPTVVSPKEYKKRFRKAISSYFVVVPESEAPPLLSVGSPSLPPSDSSSLLSDDSQQSAREDISS